MRFTKDFIAGSFYFISLQQSKLHTWGTNSGSGVTLSPRPNMGRQALAIGPFQPNFSLVKPPLSYLLLKRNLSHDFTQSEAPAVRMPGTAWQAISVNANPPNWDSERQPTLLLSLLSAQWMTAVNAPTPTLTHTHAGHTHQLCLATKPYNPCSVAFVVFVWPVQTQGSALYLILTMHMRTQLLACMI